MIDRDELGYSFSTKAFAAAPAGNTFTAVAAAATSGGLVPFKEVNNTNSSNLVSDLFLPQGHLLAVDILIHLIWI
jgi:hypothetical protein